MTALPPSNGLVPIVDHVHVPGSIDARRHIRAGVEDPPSESWNMNGYSGVVSLAPVRSCQVLVAGS